jgi:hypothetical protein
MPQDTIDHQKNYSKISKIKREEKDLTTQHRRKSAQKSKNTHSFFVLKKSLKKENSHPNFFEKKFHPKIFLSFFPIKCCKKIAHPSL